MTLPPCLGLASKPLVLAGMVALLGSTACRRSPDNSWKATAEESALAEKFSDGDLKAFAERLQTELSANKNCGPREATRLGLLDIEVNNTSPAACIRDPKVRATLARAAQDKPATVETLETCLRTMAAYSRAELTKRAEAGDAWAQLLYARAWRTADSKQLMVEKPEGWALPPEAYPTHRLLGMAVADGQPIGDKESARQMLDRAVAAKLPRALAWKATATDQGWLPPANPQEPAELLKQALAAGDAMAQALQGEKLLATAPDQALGYYRSAVKAGLSWAAYAGFFRASLGQLKVPEQEKRDWLGTATDAAEPGALVYLAMDDGFGKFFAKDQATKATEDFASLWLPVDEFYFRKGEFNDFGIGMTASRDKAMVSYERAAELGNKRAQYRMAYYYLTGDKMPKNPGKAWPWLEKAARQGMPEAYALLIQQSEEKQESAARAVTAMRRDKVNVDQAAVDTFVEEFRRSFTTTLSTAVMERLGHPAIMKALLEGDMTTLMKTENLAGAMVYVMFIQNAFQTHAPELRSEMAQLKIGAAWMRYGLGGNRAEKALDDLMRNPEKLIQGAVAHGINEKGATADAIFLLETYGRQHPLTRRLTSGISKFADSIGAAVSDRDRPATDGVKPPGVSDEAFAKDPTAGKRVIQRYKDVYAYYDAEIILKHAGPYNRYAEGATFSRTPPNAEVEFIEEWFTEYRRDAFSDADIVSRGRKIPRNKVVPKAPTRGNYLTVDGERVFGDAYYYTPPSTAGADVPKQ